MYNKKTSYSRSNLQIKSLITTVMVILNACSRPKVSCDQPNCTAIYTYLKCLRKHLCDFHHFTTNDALDNCHNEYRAHFTNTTQYLTSNTNSSTQFPTISLVLLHQSQHQLIIYH